MIPSPHLILLSTEGFTARADLTAHAEAKADKLLRHAHPRVNFVRINVKRHTPNSGSPFFAARATAEIEGADHVAHGNAPTPEVAINDVVDKLERAVTATAGARKHRMHHLQTFKLGDGLPKTV